MRGKLKRDVLKFKGAEGERKSRGEKGMGKSKSKKKKIKQRK